MKKTPNNYVDKLNKRDNCLLQSSGWAELWYHLKINWKTGKMNEMKLRLEKYQFLVEKKKYFMIQQ